MEYKYIFRLQDMVEDAWIAYVFDGTDSAYAFYCYLAEELRTWKQ